ncbi:MAG: ubiquitin family protein [Myxococcota bacterium]
MENEITLEMVESTQTAAYFHARKAREKLQAQKAADNDATSDTDRGPGFQLLVRTANGLIYTIDGLYPETTVKELRGRIQDKVGMPAKEQLLIHTTRVLRDKGTLGVYGIQKGATLHCFGRLKGGWGEKDALEAIKNGAMVRGNVVSSIAKTKGKSFANKNFGRSINDRIMSAVNRAKEGFEIMDDKVIALLDAMGVPEGSREDFLLDSARVLCLRAQVMRDCEAGNCHDFAANTAANLIESTKNQWVFMMAMHGECKMCKPRPATLVKDGKTVSNRCTNAAFDHVFCVTYPYDPNEQLGNDKITTIMKSGKAAMVADSWHAGRLLSFADFLSNNCYHVMGSGFGPISLSNLKVTEFYLCDDEPKVPNSGAVRDIIKQELSAAQQTSGYHVDQMLSLMIVKPMKPYKNEDDSTTRANKLMAYLKEIYAEVGLTPPQAHQHLMQVIDDQVTSESIKANAADGLFDASLAADAYFKKLKANKALRKQYTDEELQRYVAARVNGKKSHREAVQHLMKAETPLDYMERQKTLIGRGFFGRPDSDWDTVQDLRNGIDLRKTLEAAKGRDPVGLLQELDSWDTAEFRDFMLMNAKPVTAMMGVSGWESIIEDQIEDMGPKDHMAIAAALSDDELALLLPCCGESSMIASLLRDFTQEKRLVEIMKTRQDPAISKAIGSAMALPVLENFIRDSTANQAIIAASGEPRLQKKLAEVIHSKNLTAKGVVKELARMPLNDALATVWASDTVLVRLVKTKATRAWLFKNQFYLHSAAVLRKIAASAPCRKVLTLEQWRRLLDKDAQAICAILAAREILYTFADKERKTDKYEDWIADLIAWTGDPSLVEYRNTKEERDRWLDVRPWWDHQNKRMRPPGS